MKNENNHLYSLRAVASITAEKINKKIQDKNCLLQVLQ